MLYYLDDKNKQTLKAVKRTNLASIKWKEEDLETLLINNMDSLISEQALMPIFRERKMQEEPDIMALDEEGNLYIFELKRWKSNSENLLQAFRYGQKFGQYDYEQLNELYHKFKKGGNALNEDHKDYFNIQSALRGDEFNRKQHFLIITDGTDIETRKAINYWKSTGLWIDAIIYRIFITDNGDKMIEYNTYSPADDVIEYEKCCYMLNTNSRYSTQDDRDMLNNKKAAAYYSPWKYKIEKIQKGDKVFLYRNGVGIVAMGIGDGKVQIKDYHNDNKEKDEEYCMNLESFTVLKTPLTAAQIKSVLNENTVFRQTMVDIRNDNGDKLWGYIIKNNI